MSNEKSHSKRIRLDGFLLNSLPNNEIGIEVLKMLLTTVAGCKNIKELR